MLNSLLVFLIGCLILAVIIYIARLILGMLALPDPVNKIALLIVGLIGLVILLGLATGAMGGGVVILR